jgi:hypothetical protein
MDAIGGHHNVFTWVPEGWPHPELVKFVDKFKSEGQVDEPWTCAAHKKIRPGDRVYLLKQRKPIGIFGIGRVLSEPARRKEIESGRGEWEVVLRFDASQGDVLCDPLEAFFVNEEQLLAIPVPKEQWQRRASGTTLAEEAARAIDEKIASASSKALWILQKDVDEAVVEVADQIMLSRTGQGFLLSPGVRRAIELRAVDLAKQHYEQRGYSVKVEGKPYDLLCTCEGRDSIYVEVKGTQGLGLEVLLTPNEVTHAREHKEQMALFVVSGITVSCVENGVPSATGGAVAIYEPWDIDSGELHTLGYSLTITKQAEQVARQGTTENGSAFSTQVKAST